MSEPSERSFLQGELIPRVTPGAETPQSAVHSESAETPASPDEESVAHLEAQVLLLRGQLERVQAELDDEVDKTNGSTVIQAGLRKQIEVLESNLATFLVALAGREEVVDQARRDAGVEAVHDGSTEDPDTLDPEQNPSVYDPND